MSKIIRMTPECIEECRRDFEESLRKAKMSDGKITFTKTFSAEKKRTTLFFTTAAWIKMFMLLQEFSKEIAWHGTAHRIDNEDGDGNGYIITDILVYPQEVSGASVEMDTEEYAKWLMENDEDERFYNMHMQGHSHVNMQPNPSSVDLNHQDEILEQLGDEDFYIFMIYNKSLKRNIKIFDLKENTLFEDADIDVRIYDEAIDLDQFIAGAKEMVKEKVYSYQPKPASGVYGYGQCHSGPYNPLYQQSGSPNQDHTGLREQKEKPKTQIGAGWMGSTALDDYYGSMYDGYRV